MSREEAALNIYCALLARDPLAQLRFTEIRVRLELLARLSHQAAAIFLASDGPESEVARIWDRHAEGAPQIPVPGKLTGAPPAVSRRTGKPEVDDLFAGS